jgi:hypothetical protein
MPIPDWVAVDEYVRTRLSSRGDVYGWARLEQAANPAALILADEAAPDDSFPETIGGVRIVLKKGPPPVRYAC